ncbi:MAG: nitronate monooxygenase [Bauldia sp.]
MALRTRLTERLGIVHPIVSAPMGFVGGGALAAAVSAAGGLGLIGGGYGEAAWLDREFEAAGNQRIGCGFITWSLAKHPELLDRVLVHHPAALMLSFGDPRPFAASIRESGAVLICQVQTIAHVREALEAGAGIIVAQGGEAGGHGARRGTLTLVPEVADLIARESPATLILAAGGIADGRGLAAALMLGADGVLMGTRFWASRETLVHANLQAAALGAGGDDTIRTTSIDVVRGYDWPKPFDIRVMRNRFSERWQGREGELADRLATEGPRYAGAGADGDAAETAVMVGEAVGLIHDVPSARDIVEGVAGEAEALIREAGNRLIG